MYCEADITVSASKIDFVKMVNTKVISEEVNIEGDREQFTAFIENTDIFTRDFGIVLP